MKPEQIKQYRQEDALILTEIGSDRERFYNAVNMPVFMNSLHTFDTYADFLQFSRDNKDDFIYGRAANPTVCFLEQKVAQLERGKKALAFASGMAASVAAVLACTEPGCHILAMKNIYRPLRTYIDTYCVQKYNMTVTYIDGRNIAEFTEAKKPQTRLILLESPSSNIFTVAPIQEVASFARREGIRTFIDNTFCTPIFQKPLELGVDLVMHTASKYLSGHSDVIAGFLVANDEALMKQIAFGIRETMGSIIGPAEAWLILRGMRTLIPRLDRHQSSAKEVCSYLKTCPKVRKVYYPGDASHPQHSTIELQQSGSTGLLSFEPDFGAESAVKFVDHLKYFHIGVSWGGFESLATLPHYKDKEEVAQYYAANRNLVRLHIGLEEPASLIEDIENAMRQI